MARFKKWAFRAATVPTSLVVTGALVVAATLALASCSGDGDDHPHNTIDCDAETRDDDFSLGMSKTGDGGITFTIVDAVPAPPARNDNAWIVRIDQGGTVLDGAIVKAKPFMPDHNHGTPTVTEVAPGSEAGEYSLAPVNLFMPGLWEVSIEATAGEVTDEVVFRFCIPS